MLYDEGTRNQMLQEEKIFKGCARPVGSMLAIIWWMPIW